VLALEVPEGEVAVGRLPLGEVDGVVESDGAVARQPPPGVRDVFEAVGDVE
jgi:hypothetical protein